MMTKSQKDGLSAAVAYWSNHPGHMHCVSPDLRREIGTRAFVAALREIEHPYAARVAEHYQREIDEADAEKAAKLADPIRGPLARGEKTVEELAAEGHGEVVEGALLIYSDWHADDGNAELSGDDLGHPESGYEAAKAYVEDGEWGQSEEGFAGTSVDVRVWRVAIDGDGDDVRVNEETHTIDIAPNEPECPAGEHEWTSEHEGGLRENPGVWATGGTSMRFDSHCKKCGMSRTEETTGAQRNPGDCDTTHYGDPDAEWVIENISPDDWSDWVIEQVAEGSVAATRKQLQGYEDDERFAAIFEAIAGGNE